MKTSEPAHYCGRRSPVGKGDAPWMVRASAWTGWQKFCFKELQRVEDRWRCPQHGFLDKVSP